MSASGEESANFDTLLGSLKRVATDFLSQDESIASAAATQRTVSEMRNELENALASSLRDRNALTVVGRVPPELWICVWKYASFDDLVSSARVCSSWRTTAHANSGLWTTIEVTSTLHHQACDCDECEASLSRSGETNLGAARIALENLSGGRPVTLAVSSESWQANEIYIKQLQRCIASCAARLVELNIAYNDNLFPSSVLGAVAVFPALHTLRMRCLYLHAHEDPASFLPRGGMQFPALRDLDVGPYLSWSPPADTETSSRLSLPVIQDLTCTFETEHDIALALRACATGRVNLCFHWRLNIVQPEIFAVGDVVQSVLDELRNARISNIPAAQEDAVLGTFTRVPREFLQLGYLERTVARGLRACRHLNVDAGLALRLERFGDMVELDVHDGYNAVEVAFPAVPAGRAAIDWDRVPELLTSMTVEAALWDDVLHALPSAPRVKEIVLRVIDGGCLDSVRLRDDSTPWVFATGVSLRIARKFGRGGGVSVRAASVERVKSLLSAQAVAFDEVLVRD